jgi:hypothetical protein
MATVAPTGGLDLLKDWAARSSTLAAKMNGTNATPGELKVHFDTNHHLTVIWDPENLQDAATVCATIRATLPAEAKMPAD